MTKTEQSRGGAINPRQVVLINAHDNPVAALDEAAFSAEWKWHRTAPEWKPGDALPVEAAQIEALVVFAAKYQEEDITRLCDGIRQDPALGSIPLLVAVDQYQMPLANRERAKPNTDFIVIPLEEPSLREHLERARKDN